MYLFMTLPTEAVHLLFLTARYTTLFVVAADYKFYNPEPICNLHPLQTLQFSVKQ